MLKLVTVLFADIVGSTAWAQKRHPEDLRALISDYLAAMAREIQSEGGTIEKLVGGAMMAVFGVPAVHEDDAVRAVRAARRMLERLRSFNEARDPAEALAIRIGLSTGDVLASGVAGGDLDVTGGAVNVAARLQQIAEPGTIVVADRTARAVGSHFELRAIDEPLALNGDSEALAAWLVEGRRERSEPRGYPAVTTPLVGRAHELAFLRTTFDGVRLEGRPALVTVVGDAGVGKSQACARVPLAARGRGEGAGRALPRLRARRHPVASGRDAEDRSGRARDGPVRRSRREDRNARRDRASSRSWPANRRAARRPWPRRWGCGRRATPSHRSTRGSSTASWWLRGGRCSSRWQCAPQSSPWWRTCTGPTRRCSTSSTSSPSGSTAGSSSSARRAPSCSARARTGAEGVGASARCRSTH